MRVMFLASSAIFAAFINDAAAPVSHADRPEWLRNFSLPSHDAPFLVDVGDAEPVLCSPGDVVLGNGERPVDVITAEDFASDYAVIGDDNLPLVKQPESSATGAATTSGTQQEPQDPNAKPFPQDPANQTTAAAPGARILSRHELDTALAYLKGERITREFLESRIVDTHFFGVGPTVTVCNITVDNGFSVRGSSACVDPANYNAAIVRTIAYERAFAKLWPLYGFLLAERRYVNATSNAA